MIDSGMFRMTASDEDPVSRGKNNKKNSGNKGNKKEEKKKAAKESPKEQSGKKAEGKAPKNAPASTNPTEKKNKGKFLFFFWFRPECVIVLRLAAFREERQVEQSDVDRSQDRQ